MTPNFLSHRTKLRWHVVFFFAAAVAIAALLLSPRTTRAQATLLPALGRTVPGGEGPGWDGLSVYAEAYNTHFREQDSIHLYALSAELNFRTDRPLLRPFSIGALVSLYGTEGEDFGTQSPPIFPHRDASSFGASVGFMARAYALETERFALFTEISGSLAWFERPFPPGGTPWNGVMRAGGGIRAKLGSNTSLVFGARWLHVSNGGDAGRNPAYDGLGGYFGFSHAWGGFRQMAEPVPLQIRTPRFGLTAPTTGVVIEFYDGGPGEVDTLNLHVSNGEYVYYPKKLPWLGLVGSMSLYYAAGDKLADPNRGLGLFNAGSVGYGFNLGLRPTWRIDERVSVFAEVHGGILATTRVWPFLSGGGRYYEPWKWHKGVRVGAGVSWRIHENWSLLGGYRRLTMDTSDERPTTVLGFAGDAPDFDSGGFFLGLQREF